MLAFDCWIAVASKKQPNALCTSWNESFLSPELHGFFLIARFNRWPNETRALGTRMGMSNPWKKSGHGHGHEVSPGNQTSTSSPFPSPSPSAPFSGPLATSLLFSSPWNIGYYYFNNINKERRIAFVWIMLSYRAIERINVVTSFCFSVLPLPSLENDCTRDFSFFPGTRGRSDPNSVTSLGLNIDLATKSTRKMRHLRRLTAPWFWFVNLKS